MAGIESPLPPFYAPPEFNFENIKNGEIFSWVFWNTLYVIVTPVKATLYLGSLAWNKLSGKPISSRDVQPEKACPKVNPNYVSTTTPAENTPQAESCDHSHSPVIPLQKLSAKPDGLSQKSSQGVTSQGPVKIPKQSQHQYIQQRDEAQKGQSALINQQRVDEINESNFNRGVKQSLKFAERQKFREDRRAARENSLAEQGRSRGRSQAEQALLTQDSAISQRFPLLTY